ncbi:hypothetical protein POPTR_001G351101v4 [Populus trichocarpa]|uniref:Uncharacterized protein n=1 Tax=Populus trichocarpa TaxID=3694 RepID=A0ACC0TNM6_POPTR|nr:hypothetical protein BDE02_01G312700 [Populus trichocarpa]KAI9402956.1 hypothetical protein POPTR_001G351101v4 [Populus trichocarpa]
MEGLSGLKKQEDNVQEALPLLNDQPLSSPLNSELFQPITIPVTTLSKHNVKKEREGEGERERER